MADIAVRRTNGGQLAPLPRPPDPLNMVRDLLRWDPFQEMTPLWPEVTQAYLVPFEVKETKDAYEFKADVPGIKEQDLDLSLSGNRLTVSGKRDTEKEDTGETYYTYERSYGSFCRSFTLPEGIDMDHTRAELRNGVLSIVIAKKAEYQPKKIAVKTEKAKA